MLIDSHCHLEFDEFEADLMQALMRAKKVGVELIQTICTKMSGFHKVIQVANKADFLYCSVGVHPHEVEREGLFSGEMISSLCSHSKVIGVGETGLDYHYPNSNAKLQQRSFVEHIRAAQLTGLPLIVHTRDAEMDTVEILKEQMCNAPFKAVIHCFTSSERMAIECLNLGFYISFSGIITFKNAKPLQDIFKLIPLNRVLLETDAPYLAPTPYRGKRNEPAFIKNIAEYLASLREVSVDEIANITTKNFFNLFDKARLC